MTVQLSCHVQNFIAITSLQLGWEQNEIWKKKKIYNGKIACAIGHYLLYGDTNPCAEFIWNSWKYKKLFPFSVIAQHRDGSCSWNPSTWKVMPSLSCMLVADVLMAQGARASATMVFIVSSEYSRFSTWLSNLGIHNDTHVVAHFIYSWCKCVDIKQDPVLNSTQIAKFMGPTWALWAPCWPHEPCYQGKWTTDLLPAFR